MVILKSLSLIDIDTATDNSRLNINRLKTHQQAEQTTRW